ncbi:MAG: hypothetical protein AAF432_07640 [Planctomycetota bacterium]
MTARRPTRIRTQIIACAIAGFVVSWAIVALIPIVDLKPISWIDVKTPIPEQSESVRNTIRDLLTNWEHDVALYLENDRSIVSGMRALGKRQIRIDRRPPNDPYFVENFGRTDFGWPFFMARYEFAGTRVPSLRRSLLIEQEWSQGGPKALQLHGVLTAERDFESGVGNEFVSIPFGGFSGFTSDPLAWEPWAMPTTPLLPGMLANTSLYGIVLWLLWFAPRYIRRWRRLRREKCIICAYPTKHGETCSECGTIAAGMRWRHAHTSPSTK